MICGCDNDARRSATLGHREQSALSTEKQARKSSGNCWSIRANGAILAPASPFAKDTYPPRRDAQSVYARREPRLCDDQGSPSGNTRDEYEYEIPLGDANEILDNLCEHPPIEKTRYRIVFKGHTWEVHEFAGANRGLTVAEVELKDAGEQVELPDWIDREVSGDSRYSIRTCRSNHSPAGNKSPDENCCKE